MKFIVIVNPFSGKKQGSEIFNKIKKKFDSKNIDLTLITTEFPGHAEKIIKECNFENYHGILMIGGDGTFHEIVNGMFNRMDKKKIPIGIIPGGTGNSFMLDLGITDSNLAVDKILMGKTRFIDVIKLDMEQTVKYSINLVGWGMITDIGFTAENLRWMGNARYTISAIIQIFFKNYRKAEFEINGKRSVKNFMFVVGCNSIHVGKGMRMAPKAKLDDGLMDIIVVDSNISRIRLLSVLPKLFKGTHIDEPEVQYYQSNKFSLIPDNYDSLIIDGEMIGKTPIVAEIIPSSIDIFA